MTEKKKAFEIVVIRPEVRRPEIIRSIIKERLEKTLAKNGFVAHNLDEVLQKHISGEMRNEQKRER